MTSLWLYKRRACCTVRYRHGGYNAVIPMELHTVGCQVMLMQQQAERRRAEAAVRSRADRVATDSRSNVLNFSDRGAVVGKVASGAKRPSNGGAAGG